MLLETTLLDTTVNLEQMGSAAKRASRQLVQDILQHADQVPDSLQDLIVNSADGNPFFVEELIKMLVDDGVRLAGARRLELERKATHDGIVIPDALKSQLDVLAAS